MSLEIRRIAPVRAANVVAVLYFILFALFTVPMYFFVGDMPAQPNLDPAQQAAVARGMRRLMLAYPFLGAAFGWLGSALAAAIYNLISPRLGGLLFEVSETGTRTSGSVA